MTIDHKSLPPADAAAAPVRNFSWWVSRIVPAVLAVIFGLIFIAKIATWNDLPECDSRKAKDTLSDIFKRNNVNASQYNEIKKTATKHDELSCSASLALQAGGNLDLDYRIFRDGDGFKLEITRSQTRP